MASLNINGKTQEVDVDPATPLLWALREQVGLTGTKYGCGIAQCGAVNTLLPDSYYQTITSYKLIYYESADPLGQ